jgi:DNA invertase Pin-like site-specific DNA recombinase
MLIGYARVSTDDQNTKLQIDALKGAGCERIFEEKASGARADRPELTKATTIAREGDVIVVRKLDRLGRSLPHLIATIRGLAEQGIGFRSLTENIDTTSSGGKLVFHLFGALAEFERDIIRERTNAGLKAARAQGRVGGRRRVMTAGDLKLARTLITDPSWTRDAIAAKIGVSHMTIYRELMRAGISKRSTRTATLPNQRATRSLSTRPQSSKRSQLVRKSGR